MSSLKSPKPFIEKLDEVAQDLRSPSTVTETDLASFFYEFVIPPGECLALLDSSSTLATILEGYCCVCENFFKEYGIQFPIPHFFRISRFSQDLDTTDVSQFSPYNPRAHHSC